MVARTNQDPTYACTTKGMHKRTYVSSTDAKRAAKRMRTRTGGPSLVAFRCEHGWWVLGHGPKAKKRTA